MDTKVCTKCNNDHPLECYSKSRKTQDGLSYWCKSCHNQYRINYNKKNPNYKIEYGKINKKRLDKQRHERYVKIKDIENSQSAEWRDKNKKRNLELKKRWYKKNKNNEEVKSKNKTRRKTNYAIQSGRMIRPPICSKCKKKCKPDAHHKDYNDYLDILWLCSSCHAEQHSIY